MARLSYNFSVNRRDIELVMLSIYEKKLLFVNSKSETTIENMYRIALIDAYSDYIYGNYQVFIFDSSVKRSEINIEKVYGKHMTFYTLEDRIFCPPKITIYWFCKKESDDFNGFIDIEKTKIMRDGSYQHASEELMQVYLAAKKTLKRAKLAKNPLP